MRPSINMNISSTESNQSQAVAEDGPKGQEYLNENQLYRGHMALRGPGALQHDFVGEEKELLENVTIEEKHGFHGEADHLRKRKAEYLSKSTLNRTQQAFWGPGHSSVAGGTGRAEPPRIDDSSHGSKVYGSASSISNRKVIKEGVSDYTYWFHEWVFVVKEQEFWLVHSEYDIWCDWLSNVEARDIEGNVRPELATTLVDEPKFDFKLHPSGKMIAFTCMADVFVIPLDELRAEITSRVEEVYERMQQILHSRNKNRKKSSDDNLSEPGSAQKSPNSIMYRFPHNASSKRCPTDKSTKEDAHFVINQLELEKPVKAYQVTVKQNEDVMNGVADYLMQEEFNRQEGFWWCPCTFHSGTTTIPDPSSHNSCDSSALDESDMEDEDEDLMMDASPTNVKRHDYVSHSKEKVSTVYAIAYMSVDESKVPVVKVPQEGFTMEYDSYRYSKPGDPNPACTLCVALFDAEFTQPIRSYFHYDLFKTFVPWVEYIVTVTWIYNGRRLALQVLNRTQTRYALVIVDPLDSSNYTIIKEIFRKKGWVNVMHQIHPLKKNPHKIVFVMQDPFTHVYLLTLKKDYSFDSLTQVTDGEWEVISDTPLIVDETREIVYFKANYGAITEHHLFGAPIHHEGPVKRPVQLSVPGHTCHDFHFDHDRSRFVYTYSSVETIPQCDIMHLQKTGGVGVVPQFTISSKYKYAAPSISTLFPYSLSKPQLFSFHNGKGEVLCGVVYRPINYDPSQSYPCVVSVYAGPCFSMIQNSFALTGNGRNQMFANRGYCVVIIDGRGSFYRGYDFEKCFKYRLCQFEHEDNITAVQYLKNTHDPEIHVNIDMDNVGIIGWSYGGSASLMALAKRGDFFRCACAIAPVTTWDMYDSAYTERYMGMPQEHKDDYEKSSILNHVKDLPDEDGRLMIAHGFHDTNVFFKHTELLIEQLNEYCKPYNLSLYPGCRHSIRNGTRHLTHSVLKFFEDGLKRNTK